MKILTVDMESYYDKEFSLSKIATEAYIRDPRFEVIGVSVMVDDAEPLWFSGTRKETRAWLLQFPWDTSLALSHNAHFDMAILNWHFGIRPKGYLDTLSMANALYGINQSVSLKSLSEHHGLPDKGTEVLAAIGKRRCDFSAEELEAYGLYCQKDVWLCRTLFDIMAPSFSKSELKLVDMTIRMFAEPVLVLDKPMLEQHLIDVRRQQLESLRKLSELLKTEDPMSREADVKTVLMSNPKFATLLKKLKVDPPMKISPTTGKEAYAFAKTDEAFAALLEHDNPLVQAAVAARLGNKTTIEGTRTEAFLGVAERGAFPFPLKYSGAAVTHRWSGFDYNVQNMGRDSALRRSIKAPKGFKILAADLSNIELRLGLYLAQQDDKLKLIDDGVDLYVDIATVIFNKSYGEIVDLGKKSRERTTGKVVNLSCIYSTGAVKLKDTLRVQGGVRFSLEETQRMVDLYRSEFHLVATAWNEGREVLEALHRKQVYGEYLRPGILNVTREGIVKPSGLVLTYPKLGWTKDTKDGKMGFTYEQKRKMRDRVYGSKVFQRCTQSLARDIIAEHMLKIDKQFHVVGTVHDEIICVVAEDEVLDAKDFMLEVMRTAPAWAEGLPLDAEIGVGDNYGESK